MKQAWNKTKHLVAALIYIIGMLVFVSLFDIIVAVLGGRFYSDAAFVALFGVSGVFAAFLGYGAGVDTAETKNKTTRRSLGSLLAITGLLFIFFFSEIEGGEYRIPFKAYGITIVATSLFLLSGKFDDL